MAYKRNKQQIKQTHLFPMNLVPFSSPHLELIEWEDISVCDVTWSDKSDIESWYDDAADAIVEQVGFLLYEDDKNVLLGSSIIESMELFGEVTKIPKAVIKNRVILTAGVASQQKAQEP